MVANDPAMLCYHREGAAIVVQTPRISSGFAHTLYNPQCFLQFNDSNKPPVDWDDEEVQLFKYFLIPLSL